MISDNELKPLTRYSLCLVQSPEGGAARLEMCKSDTGEYVAYEPGFAEELARLKKDCATLQKALDRGARVELELAKERNRLRVIAGMDQPWPLTDVLEKLLEASEHLLQDHDCDVHGHEEFKIACLRGREILKTLRSGWPEKSCAEGHFSEAANVSGQEDAALKVRVPFLNPGRDNRPQVQVLFSNLKQALPQLKALLAQCHADHTEDFIYRFYHQSFKVYGLQQRTIVILEALRALAPQQKLHAFFEQIFKEGTGKHFELEHNQRWLIETRPILEAFFHARYFLEVAVHYGEELEEPPRLLPGGWAAFLYLFRLR